MGGKLVAFNCGCPGPQVYDAAVTIALTAQFKQEKCPAQPPRLRSKKEYSFRKLWQWLEVCVFKTIVVKMPKAGNKCEMELTLEQKIAEAKEVRKRALARLARDQHAFTKAASAYRVAVQHESGVDAEHYELRDAAAKKTAKARMVMQFAKNQYDSVKNQAITAKHRFDALQGKGEDLGDVHIAKEKEHYAMVVQDLDMKKEALVAVRAEMEATQGVKKRLAVGEEIARVREMVLAAETNKLNALKHLDFLERHVQHKKQKEARRKHMERQTKVASQQASFVVGTRKPTEADISAERARHAKLKSLDKQLAKANKNVKKLMDHQNRIEATLKKLRVKRGSTDRKVVDYEMKYILAQQATFYGNQLSLKIQHNIKQVGAAAPIVVEWNSVQAKRSAATAVQTALQAAADELATYEFNSAVLPNIWTPPTAVCKMGFVMETGVCSKGPFVYPRCSVGPYGADVTVEAGCGCTGQLMRNIMVGNVEKPSGWPGAKRCVKDFHRHAEMARQNVFKVPQIMSCAQQIHSMCKQNAHLRKEAMQNRQTGLKGIVRGIERQKNQVIKNRISIYKQSIKQLTKTILRLRHDLATPAIWSAPIKYRKIPGMHLLDNGDLHPNTPLKSCRNMCSSDRKCKSISFRKVDNSCYMSVSTMTYDYSFNCYLKKTGQDMPGKDSFDIIPGMKIVNSDTKKLESKVDKVALSECQGDCLNSDKCRSVSYAKSTGECLRSDVSLSYDDAWDYFDKDTSGLPKFDVNHWDAQVGKERRTKIMEQMRVAEKVLQKRQRLSTRKPR